MLKNLKIGMRLGIGFGVMLALILVVGITGYWGVNKSTSATNEMLKGDAVVAGNAERLRANVVGMRRYEKDIFLNIGDKAKIEAYHEKLMEQDEHADQRSGANQIEFVFGRLPCGVGIENGPGAQDLSIGMRLSECCFGAEYRFADSLLQCSVVGRTGEIG